MPSRVKKVALLVATLMPWLFFAAFLAAGLMVMPMMMPKAPGQLPPWMQPGGTMPPWFFAMFGGECLLVLWMMSLLACYIWNVFHNPRLPSDKRALWAVVLFLGHLFAMPVYWWIYIWPEQQPMPRE